MPVGAFCAGLCLLKCVSGSAESLTPIPGPFPGGALVNFAPPGNYAKVLFSANGIGIGSSNDAFGSYVATRWDSSGSVELNNLGVNDYGIAFAFPYAINHFGTVVGTSEKFIDGVDMGPRAVRWDAGSTAITELGMFGTGQIHNTALADGINNSGTAVGMIGVTAVRWDASGTPTRLGNLDTGRFGLPSGNAYAVNDSGTAVGFSAKYVSNKNVGNRPVRWDASGTSPTELDNLGTDPAGVTSGAALFINNAGTAAGYVEKYVAGVDIGRRAVRWDPGGTAAIELGDLGTSNTGSTGIEAWGLNTSGTVIGDAAKYVSGVYKGVRAVRWDSSSNDAIELGTLGDYQGYTTAQAFAMNDAGIAAGYALQYDAQGYSYPRAVIWDHDGAAIDLNSLIDPNSGWVLSYADDINNDNWVTGIMGPYPGGSNAMFVMHIPEPATATLSALVALACLLQRRAKRV